MSENAAKLKSIGLDVPVPAARCEDTHCPFHGTLSVRGHTIVGKVVSTKMQRSVVVEKERRFYVKKYERYEKRSSRYIAHLPDCIPVSEGDEVLLSECRKLSKHISFVVVQNRSLKEAVAK